MNNNEINHYGVPGMKWGQRKVRSRSFGRKRKRRVSRYERRTRIIRRTLKTSLTLYGINKLSKITTQKSLLSRGSSLVNQQLARKGIGTVKVSKLPKMRDYSRVV